jgi:hypothetical protein
MTIHDTVRTFFVDEVLPLSTYKEFYQRFEEALAHAAPNPTLQRQRVRLGMKVHEAQKFYDSSLKTLHDRTGRNIPLLRDERDRMIQAFEQRSALDSECRASLDSLFNNLLNKNAEIHAHERIKG